MDLDEARAVIAEQHHAVLATLRRDGTPQMSPVAAAVDAAGRVIISTRQASYKVRNLRRDPRLWYACCPTGSSVGGSRWPGRCRSSSCPTRWSRWWTTSAASRASTTTGTTTGRRCAASSGCCCAWSSPPPVQIGRADPVRREEHGREAQRACDLFDRLGRTPTGAATGTTRDLVGSPDVSVGGDHAAARPGSGGQRPPRVRSAMAMRDSGLRP